VKTHTVGVSTETETDPWVNVPKQELNLQEVQELDEESKELGKLDTKHDQEDNVELNLEEQNIEGQSEEDQMKDLYASNDLIKVRDQLVDSINNSALMEAEKQQEEQLLSEQEDEKEQRKDQKPSNFQLEEEEDIKEHK
jgi:hypothetical protein